MSMKKLSEINTFVQPGFFHQSVGIHIQEGNKTHSLTVSEFYSGQNLKINVQMMHTFKIILLFLLYPLQIITNS